MKKLQVLFPDSLPIGGQIALEVPVVVEHTGTRRTAALAEPSPAAAVPAHPGCACVICLGRDDAVEWADTASAQLFIAYYLSITYILFICIKVLVFIKFLPRKRNRSIWSLVGMPSELCIVEIGGPLMRRKPVS